MTYKIYKVFLLVLMIGVISLGAFAQNANSTRPRHSRSSKWCCSRWGDRHADEYRHHTTTHHHLSQRRFLHFR